MNRVHVIVIALLLTFVGCSTRYPRKHTGEPLFKEGETVQHTLSQREVLVVETHQDDDGRFQYFCEWLKNETIHGGFFQESQLRPCPIADPLIKLESEDATVAATDYGC